MTIRQRRHSKACRGRHRNNNNAKQRSDKDNASNAPIKLKCSYCKKKGHKAADCYCKAKADAQSASAANEIFSAIVGDDASHSVESAWNTVCDPKWCLDSGCTSYLCNDSELFTSSHQLNSGIKLASDATAPATAKGDVQNTLYVPTLRTNLISVAKIIDKKHQVLFTEDRAYIKDAHGNTKMIVDRVGNLFYLRRGEDAACTISSDEQGQRVVLKARTSKLVKYATNAKK
ncbi:uncharacterized protein [Mycetomoellerius zeteki]|uniref:uncharacterized protein n=1 Tax=Mycetomoellerius zeteki TaxID=64791 RepID=UPI00084EA511|nr:PREDICTED: uncharacterized protein LOC108723432 [Trachymyrmex zeteki]